MGGQRWTHASPFHSIAVFIDYLLKPFQKGSTQTFHIEVGVTSLRQAAWPVSKPAERYIYWESRLCDQLHGQFPKQQRGICIGNRSASLSITEGGEPLARRRVQRPQPFRAQLEPHLQKNIHMLHAGVVAITWQSCGNRVAIQWQSGRFFGNRRFE